MPTRRMSDFLLPQNCHTAANQEKYAEAGQYAQYANDALWILHNNANLLTADNAQANFDSLIEKLIAAEKHHKCVYTALKILKEANLLTGDNAQANFDKLVNAKVNAKILFKILRKFQSENCLDQDNFNTIHEAGGNAWPVAEALLSLKQTGLLTDAADAKKYRYMVCKVGEGALPVAIALSSLKDRGLPGDGAEITEAYDTLVTDWRKSPHVDQHWKESSPQEFAYFWAIPHGAKELVEKHIISFEQALDLDMNQEQALEKKEVRDMLFNGRLHEDLQRAGNTNEILATARSRCKIRRYARLFRQSHRSSSPSLLRALHPDLLAKIVSFAGNHEEKTAKHIIEHHSGRP